MGLNASVAETATPEQRIRSGASWFYWIAALSLVNSISAALGSDWGFVIGLGITQVFDALALAFESDVATVVGMVVNVGVAGVVALAGYLARKRRWIYATGMALFGLDSLLFLLVGDWIGVGFHAFVLVVMVPGLKAFGNLGAVELVAPTEPVELVEAPETASAPVSPT